MVGLIPKYTQSQLFYNLRSINYSSGFYHNLSVSFLDL